MRDDAAPHSAERTVLMVVADCPGHFVETTYGLAERLRACGLQPVFAVTARYYERFKGYSFSELGPVRYLSDYLVGHHDDPRVPDVHLDYWLTHPTFVRTRYFNREHINDWDDYRRLVLYVRDLFEEFPGTAAVWSEMPSSATIRIALSEAEQRGVPFLGYISARVPGHFNVVTDSFGAELMTNPSPPAEVAQAEPDYMANPMATLTRTSVPSLVSGATGKLISAWRSRGERSLEMGAPHRVQISWYRRQIQRKLYYRYLVPKRFFCQLPDVDRTRRAVVFPLHYRPEASTSVQAQHYESDFETLRNVAFSMPHGADLYVKEHPSAVGLHSRAFYRSLRSLPTVRLLDAEPALAAVLHRFDAVVTLTSTAGFEALQHGLPVVLLGRTFYERYPGVVRVGSWEELPHVLESVLAGQARAPDPGSAMSQYLETCFPGSFNYMSATVGAPANLDALFEPLRLLLRQAPR